MALGDAYAQPWDLETRLGRSDDGTYMALLDAASRRVEQFTRRQFNKTTTATARRFRAVDPWRLPVDDFHTATGLEIDVNGTAWTVADVELYPANGVVDGQTGWPFYDLVPVAKSWTYARRATIEVTAQWGWAAVPQAIIEATLDVAAVMSYGSASGGYPVAAEAIDTYRVSYYVPGAGAYSEADQVPADLKKAVPYRRRRGFGVA